MLRNYLTTAWRNLRRQKGYAAINVFGLALGLGACLLIVLYVQHEWSYDRFHEQSDRIYRVLEHDTSGSGGSGWTARMQGPMGPALVADVPEVEQAVRFYPKGEILFRTENRRFYEDDGYRTDPAFFDVFSFPLQQGNPETALSQPDAIVLTESLAETYFGDQNPLGRTLTLGEDDERTVTGVVEDPPSNSQIRFSYLVPLPDEIHGMSLEEWGRFSAFQTYVLLRSDANVEAVEEKLSSFADTYMGGRASDVRHTLQPITEAYLYSPSGAEPYRSGDPTYLYLFGAVAALILLIAVINYVNLAVARATRRVEEVGIRKTVGADRGHIAKQFLSESLLVVAVAVAIALVLVRFSLPAFETLFAVDLAPETLPGGWLALGLVATVLVVGVGAGSYPALFLSSFRPSGILQGSGQYGGRGGLLRKALVVFQFAIAVVLLACTGVVYQQLQYMQSEKLSQEDGHVLVFDLKSSEAQDSYPSLKNELQGLPFVTEVAGSAGGFTRGMPTFYTPAPESEERIALNVLRVDRAFPQVTGLTVVEGDDFVSSQNVEADRRALINETAARTYGWADPVGKELPLGADQRTVVVGVVEDFPYSSLRESIDPLAIVEGAESPQYVNVRIQTPDLSNAIQEIEEVYQTFAPAFPFVYSFLDEDFDALYQQERRVGRIFGAFALLAIFVACLGLFGLAAYAAERRRKEIAIRKVLGATARSVMALISTDFLKLVAVAFVLATPVAYGAAQRWLENFAYRIELGPWIFLLAGLLAVLIALVTVSSQALRAAWTDPATTIRQE